MVNPFKSVRIIIKKSLRIKRNPPTLLMECKLVQPLWRTAWRFLKKLKLELPYDPAMQQFRS